MLAKSIAERRWLWSALAVAALLGCSRGGGGGGSRAGFDSRAVLLDVQFPDPADQNAEPEDEAPTTASLVQQIVMTFSGAPNPAEVGANTLPIRNGSTNVKVLGTYDVKGNVVTFTPALPSRAPVIQGEAVLDNGGAGLDPDTTYNLRIGANTWGFVVDVSSALRLKFKDPADPKGIVIGFRTTSDPALFYTGLTVRDPSLRQLTPADGAEISPQLLSDPDGLFLTSFPFVLTYSDPLNPASTNISDVNFQLIDLDDGNLALGIDVAIVDNRLTGCVVEVRPSGILPFGHMLALEGPRKVQHLSDTMPPALGSQVLASFTVEDVPAGVDTIEDLIFENFDSSRGQDLNLSEASIGIAPGILPASWDKDDSNILQAAISVQGGGLLGEFKPPAPPPGQTRSITFDTNNMTFPLLNGSTPGAPQVTISGGVFPFTDIDIPAGIIIRPVGSNPLVLTATGSVKIAGSIIADGQPGGDENAYDSAVTAIPGGNGVAGGGRGGESNPVLYFPPTQPSNKTLVSTPKAGDGWGPGNVARIGGQGGQCGMYDNDDPNNPDPNNPVFTTDREITCDELSNTHNNQFQTDANGNLYPKGYKPPGGGGGSYLTRGSGRDHPDTLLDLQNGRGNVLADGLGGWIVRTVDFLRAGNSGVSPFADGIPQNDFIGLSGELSAVAGGQGGGGGGSALDNYYCGDWCRFDADVTNDSVCFNEFGGTFAGAAGDSRGGSAGAGGGAIVIRALGPVELIGSARLSARGGQGGGGEAIACSQWAGAGGSGSGGAIVVESGDSIDIKSTARLDVFGGAWRLARARPDYIFPCTIGRGQGVLPGEVPGDGGKGGDGIIQLQTPPGTTPTVASTISLQPLASWVDQGNVLNPSTFSPESVALSHWYDLGRVTQRAPSATNPVFEFLRHGVAVPLGADPKIQVDASGFVQQPDLTDIVCDYLGKIDPENQGRYLDPPRKDFIPANATIRVEFQGGDPMAPGSKEVNLLTVTPWDASPEIANGKQFLRYRITFNVTEGDGSLLSADSSLPVIQSLRVKVRF